MNQNTFCMAGGVARNPITLDFLDGEHIAIAGPMVAVKVFL